MSFVLVLLRHGKTSYNVDKKFCGWTDVELGELGEKEARFAGQLLAKNGFVFDVAFTSFLKRAIKTTWIVLEELDLFWIPVVKHWRLNERHYGALQGLKHEEMANKVGADQVFLWRRSFNVRPPLLDKSDSRNPINEAKYRSVEPFLLPLGESLEDTINRVLPFWFSDIVPVIKSGKRVLISAHGNSLRALVKHIEDISDVEIPKVEIPTAKPLVYELDSNLRPLKKFYLE
ncbi:MAG: 2,3-diphosphoglycerate-dependent phosphoglycerate mutase [Candidatus Diapherotrites archaeon]